MSTIRLLREADAPAYKVLMLHGYEHAADAFTSTPEERARESDAWWVRRVADPAGLMLSFGAFEGAALVGTVALEFSAKPKTQHIATVVGMYVLAAQRGRGLARGLMEAAIALCRTRGGIEVMQLTVTDGNAPAQALYATLGFERYGLEPMALRTPGGWRAKAHMWMRLA